MKGSSGLCGGGHMLEELGVRYRGRVALTPRIRGAWREEGAPGIRRDGLSLPLPPPPGAHHRDLSS